MRLEAPREIRPGRVPVVRDRGSLRQLAEQRQRRAGKPRRIAREPAGHGHLFHQPRERVAAHVHHGVRHLPHVGRRPQALAFPGELRRTGPEVADEVSREPVRPRREHRQEERAAAVGGVVLCDPGAPALALLPDDPLVGAAEVAGQEPGHVVAGRGAPGGGFGRILGQERRPHVGAGHAGGEATRIHAGVDLGVGDGGVEPRPAVRRVHFGPRSHRHGRLRIVELRGGRRRGRVDQIEIEALRPAVASVGRRRGPAVRGHPIVRTLQSLQRARCQRGIDRFASDLHVHRIERRGEHAVGGRSGCLRRPGDARAGPARRQALGERVHPSIAEEVFLLRSRAVRQHTADHGQGCERGPHPPRPAVGRHGERLSRKPGAPLAAPNDARLQRI